jgi:hypothetical protein
MSLKSKERSEDCRRSESKYDIVPVHIAQQTNAAPFRSGLRPMRAWAKGGTSTFSSAELCRQSSDFIGSVDLQSEEFKHSTYFPLSCITRTGTRIVGKAMGYVSKYFLRQIDTIALL